MENNLHNLLDRDYEKEEVENRVTVLKAEVERLTAHNERLTATYEEQREIISRIWKMLGSPTYDELAGRSIYDLIASLQSQLARMAAWDALQRKALERISKYQTAEGFIASAALDAIAANEADKDTTTNLYATVREHFIKSNN